LIIATPIHDLMNSGLEYSRYLDHHHALLLIELPRRNRKQWAKKKEAKGRAIEMGKEPLPIQGNVLNLGMMTSLTS